MTFEERLINAVKLAKERGCLQHVVSYDGDSEMLYLKNRNHDTIAMMPMIDLELFLGLKNPDKP